MQIKKRMKGTVCALGMLGFGANALFGDLVPIGSDQVYDGGGKDENRILLNENTTEGYSISNGATLTIQNFTRVGSSYPDDAVGPLPEIEFGGGAVYLDLGSTFLSAPIVAGGTGSILFLNNISQADSGSRNAFGGAVFGRTGSSLQITSGGFGGNIVCGATDGAGSGKGGAVYSQGDTTLTDVDFTGNVAGDAEIGPGMGGAFFGDFDSVTTIADSNFTSNTAIGGRDALSMAGGGGAIFNRGELVISSSSFITNALTDGDTEETSLGGGAIANQGGILTITNTVFDQNSSVADGGALLGSTIIDDDVTYAGKMTVSNCTFTGNTAAGTGGAAGSGNEQLFTLEDCTFTGNSAGAAGAVFSANSLINNCTFTGNAANKLVAGIVKIGMGGAIMTSAAKEKDSKIAIVNTAFRQNSSNNSGGALFNASGVIEITGGDFTENTAGTGGAIYSLSGAITLTDVIFTGNTGTASTKSTSHSGGAIGLTEDAIVRFVVTGGKTLSYTGNSARGAAAPGAHDAAAGGFLFLKTNGGKSPAVTFELAADATLILGAADAADSALDSIASNDAHSSITKTGAGTLVLHADNSGFKGTFHVSGGKLVVGESEHAAPGGQVIVENGAILSVGGNLTVGAVGPSSLKVERDSLVTVGKTATTKDGSAIYLCGGTLALPGEFTTSELLADLNLKVFDGTQWTDADSTNLLAVYLDGTKLRYADTYLYDIHGDGAALDGCTVVSASPCNLGWADCTSYGNYWFGGSWYGSFYYEPDYGHYIWHAKHGWQYAFPQNRADAAYFWDYGTASWWFTDRTDYPWIFQYRCDAESGRCDGTWYRYETGATPIRVFHDWQSGGDLNEDALAQ